MTVTSDVFLRFARTLIPLLVLREATTEQYSSYILALAFATGCIAYADLGAPVLSIKKIADNAMSLVAIFSLRVIPLLCISTVALAINGFDSQAFSIAIYTWSYIYCDLIFGYWRCNREFKKEQISKAGITVISIASILLSSNIFSAFAAAGTVQVLFLAFFLTKYNQKLKFKIELVKPWVIELSKISTIYLISPLSGPIFILTSVAAGIITPSVIGSQFLVFNAAGILTHSLGGYIHAESEKKSKIYFDGRERPVIYFLSIAAILVQFHPLFHEIISIIFQSYAEGLSQTFIALPVWFVMQYETLKMTIRNVVAQKYLFNTLAELTAVTSSYCLVFLPFLLFSLGIFEFNSSSLFFECFMTSLISIKLLFHIIIKPGALHSR